MPITTHFTLESGKQRKPPIYPGWLFLLFIVEFLLLFAYLRFKSTQLSNVWQTRWWHKTLVQVPILWTASGKRELVWIGNISPNKPNVSHFFSSESSGSRWWQIIGSEQLSLRVHGIKPEILFLFLILSYKALLIIYPTCMQRWKEQYFVNVGIDCGLTIAGFYYVCFSCSDGSINGFYYDPNSR